MTSVIGDILFYYIENRWKELVLTFKFYKNNLIF